MGGEINMFRTMWCAVVGSPNRLKCKKRIPHHRISSLIYDLERRNFYLTLFLLHSYVYNAVPCVHVKFSAFAFTFFSDAAFGDTIFVY